jgi:YHS domain-containing protein
MKSLKVVAAAGFSLLLLAFALDEKADNIKCPVSGRAVDESAGVVTVSKNIGFCCDNCPKKFDAKKNLAKLGDIPTKPVNSACPLSGRPVDATKTLVVKGQTVAFCCGNCPKKFDAAKDAEKIKNDGKAFNDKCPVSGRPVAEKSVKTATVNIGFCCGECKGKFEKDPDKVLKNVKE